MRKKIVLIEDDEDACMLFKHILTNAGYYVTHFNQGKYLLDGKAQVPDLYVLDNCLPDIDGAAITKYLKTKHETKNIPVLIVSGNLSVKTKAKRAGASAFIAKPIDLSDFLQVVDRLLTVPGHTHFAHSGKRTAEL